MPPDDWFTAVFFTSYGADSTVKFWDEFTSRNLAWRTLLPVVGGRRRAPDCCSNGVVKTLLAVNPAGTRGSGLVTIAALEKDEGRRYWLAWGWLSLVQWRETMAGLGWWIIHEGQHVKTMGPPCPHLRKPCLGQTERWRNGGLGSRPSHRSQEDSEKIENCSTYSRVRLVKGLTRFHRALSCQAFNKSRQSSRVGERECKRASGPGRLPCRAAGGGSCRPHKASFVSGPPFSTVTVPNRAAWPVMPDTSHQ